MSPSNLVASASYSRARTHAGASARALVVALAALAGCSRRAARADPQAGAAVAPRSSAPRSSAPRSVAHVPPAGAPNANEPAPAEGDPPLPIDRLKAPDGFHVTLYASGVPGARSLAFGARGTLFVGTREQGRVYAIAPAGGDDSGERVRIVGEHLNEPNGVAFHDGSLYVAEVDRVLRFDRIEDRLEHPPEPVTLAHRFPEQRDHGWKFIAIGPDDRLYVPVGAPCNVCQPSDPVFATITRMKLDGSEFEIVATGVRNSVGFDFRPKTHVLWFTDNGRDRLGDNRPPDELDRLDHAGQDFGFPRCHGKDIADPEFGGPNACAKSAAPALELGPHVAALGMRFYTGQQFPAPYRGRIFIAEHGSWNRSHKLGYRVVSVRLRGQDALASEPFVTGWLEGEHAWGRPVDVEVAPDGALVISDDDAGAVYRVAYSAPGR